MNLEETIMEDMSKQMQKYIDKEILFNMLVEMGWHRVILPRFTSREHAVDIIEWLDSHCVGPFERKGSDVIFESQIDAVNYTLRWL